VSAFYTNLFVVSLDRRIKISDNFESLGQAKSNSRCHNRTLVTITNIFWRNGAYCRATEAKDSMEEFVQ